MHLHVVIVLLHALIVIFLLLLAVVLHIVILVLVLVLVEIIAIDASNARTIGNALEVDVGLNKVPELLQVANGQAVGVDLVGNGVGVDVAHQRHHQPQELQQLLRSEAALAPPSAPLAALIGLGLLGFLFLRRRVLVDLPKVGFIVEIVVLVVLVDEVAMDDLANEA